MRLKALELYGFKSFPDRTVLTFPQAVTAIVGPNGSGKSNLSDAVRWVLGERSAQSLRGGSMEDVIFGGAQDRRPLGYAEVTLTLEGCRGALPDGGDEVAVTRRYYRSGESEYLLNGQTVRLRDVSELFYDTGLGQEGYALIGQGRIDAILSARSTERRDIFEEAAGISRARHQKEETERRLDRVAADLQRIGDKLDELELQRGPLRAEAERARRCLSLREERRSLEVSLWMDRIAAARARAEELRAACADANAQVAQTARRADELYAEAESLQAEAVAQEERAAALRGQLAEQDAARNARERELALLAERRRNAADTVERLRADLARRAEEGAALDADLAAQAERQAELDAAADAGRAKVAAAQTALDEARRARQARQTAHETLLRAQRAELDRLRGEAERAQEAWFSLRRTVDELASRARALRELDEAYEGFPRGVRAAMGEVRRGGLTGVYGPVGELFRVSGDYVTAVETALGGAMQDLLVTDEEAGKAVLRWVKRHDAGRITCRPLTALRPDPIDPAALAGEPGFLARASDLVDCPEACRPAALALLGRTAVVRDLDAAVALARRHRYRFPVVTRDGEILRPGGAMTGGSVHRRGGAIGRGAERQALAERLSQAEAALAEGQARRDRARAAVQRAAQRVEDERPPVETGPLPEEGTLAALREELAGQEAARRAAGPLLDQLTARRAAAEADRARQAGQLAALEREEERLTAAIAETERAGSHEGADRAALETALREADRARQSAEDRRRQVERAARTENDAQLRLQREAAALEQERAKAAMEHSSLLDRLWDTYGLTHEAAGEVRIELPDQAAARRRAAQLADAIRAMGEVDLGAVERSRQLEERYAYLDGQRSDVATARDELTGVIAGLADEMETVFRAAFARIAAAFAETFAGLFGGGRGTLRLEDDRDPLGCGIAIEVQPPGKSLRTISLLSGGERALTAIALYFAILTVRPTPFCVMDEIEAALDEPNVARFLHWLRGPAGQTQFLLITHRRATMEAADVLYGVTMEHRGVSRVLRLDLDEVAALLGDEMT